MSASLDQTALLCDPFFQAKKSLGRTNKGHPAVQPGQLVWAHQIYPTASPFIVDIKGYDPRDTSNNSYVITKLKNSPTTHFPIKELNLRADENLYVMYGKKRPAIVLQTLQTGFYNPQNPEPYVVVAPCFTFKPKHSHEYRARIAAMEFANLFFLPSHKWGFAEEGALRLEHIQPVMAAAIDTQFCSGIANQSFLSPEAWAVLQHRLSSYFIGHGIDAGLEEQINAYRECVLEAYGLSPRS